MSSWKQYGGVKNLDTSNKINTNTLSVNTLFMKEPYVGTFDICGGLTVTQDSNLKNLNVIGTAVFSGATIFTDSFTTAGNIDGDDNANIKNNIVLGNILYFDNGNSQFIYGNVSGIGVNTYNPRSAFDISTNLIKGFNISSNQNQNISTLAQNNSGKGVQVGVDSNSSYINFFNDHTVSSSIVDGNITYNNGGFLTVDVQKNINLLAPLSISNRENVSHVNGETVVIYDTSNGIFFGNVYNNETAITGSSLSMISNDVSSNTFVYLSTPNKKGVGIGGGAYPGDVDRSMGTIGLTDISGQYTPVQMIVSGTDKVKNKITTGINTFKPRIDNYVLDINGPIHIDNGDITNVSGNIDFEIYSMSMAKNYKNNILALGSSYDVTTVRISEFEYIYREKILKSIDYGKTWNTIDIPVTGGMDAITSIHMYDQSSCFLTGQINFLQYSPDGGYNWNTFSSQLDSNTYNNFFVNPKQKVNGNVVCYFSVDASYSLLSFEMPISGVEYAQFADSGFVIDDTLQKNNNPNTKPYIDKINSIYVNDNSLYLAGNSILKYNVTNETWPTFGVPRVYTYLNYSYNGINAFDNSFVIAVGKNIISSTTDGGTSWRNTTMDTLNGNQGVDFKSVYIYDVSNAVAAGSQGNIWVTNDRGFTWNYMPFNLLNSSGKYELISSNSNNFKHVIMPDINTIVLSNNTQSYIQGVGGRSGISNIYNIFIPNYLNRSNNIVFDLSGVMNISGDLRMSDNGEIVSNNSTMNIFRKDVRTLNIGAGTETINMGNIFTGNVIIKNNLITDYHSTFNTVKVNNDFSGNFIYSNNVKVYDKIYGNIYPLVDTVEIGGGDNDIYIGGKTNTNREQSIYIGQNGTITDSVNVSKIYIGGINDYVYLRGNTTILQQVQQNVTTATFLINNSGTGANASAGGAGIDIYDNSFSSLAFKNIFGYIHVGTDLQSFIFKAPSYGAYNGVTPDPNSKSPLRLISPENRVRFGVNQLKLAKNEYVPVAGNVRTGLLVLQTNSDFIEYQTGLGQNYTASTDADYAINISNAFDISNIMLKMFDTSAGVQSIGSSVIIGNSNVPYELTVHGNTNVYGSTILYGNLQIYGNTVLPNISITNTLVSSGNVLLNGKIGIGTNAPQILLDVSGNVRFIGQMVNTNYDSIRFPINFNNNWIDNSRQALSNSYYQDITASYDAQYQYALLYNKTGPSSVIKSSNYGTSWLQIPLTNQTSLATIGQAVPTMSSNTVTFSQATLTQNIIIPSAVPLNTQIGTYVASGSSVSSGSDYFNVFDNNVNTLWISSTNNYSTGANNEINAISNYSLLDYYTEYKNPTDEFQPNWTNPTLGRIYGEYVQIALPYEFVLTTVSILNDDSNQAAKYIFIAGSANGSDWYILTTTNLVLLSQNQETPVNNTNAASAKPYSYFRFIVVTTHSIGSGSSNKASIKNIKMTGTVQNSTGTYAATISASGNGKFVTIANQGYNNNRGYIYVSNDYGTTYTNTNVEPRQLDGSGIWQGIALSQSGQYQFSAISSIVGRGNIWRSTDYGSSWVDSQFGVINGFQSISVSSTGQYVTAIQSGNITSTRGNIWVSNNYGSTWSSAQKIYSYMPFNNGFLNQGSVDFNKLVTISVNGKFQTALGIAPSNNKIGGNANIWYNNNFGQGVWIDSGYSAPVINGNVSILSSVSMTGTGQYQTVSFIGGNSNIQNQVYGNILRSTDFGVTWSDTNFKIPSTNSNNNTVYGYLPKIVTSVNGQLITGISKYESLRDDSYKNNTSSQVAVGNIFTSVIPTTSQMNTTQYFGSSHTGNVFQLHGYQLNVPINNNSSLMMGYDTAWDSVYINSADQNGYNALCLNTVGGPVGISTINPDPRFVLDVSGIVNVTNNNGVILLQGNSSNNMGVGKSVLNNITTGSNNTVLGYNSLTSITTGSNNTAIGYQAFAAATNYSQSTAIGFNAQPLASNQVVLGTATEIVYLPGTRSSTNSSTGALQVVGGVGVGGNVNINGFMNIVNDASFNGNVVVYKTTPSTSSTSGALQVVGGVGIGGNLFVQSKTTMVGDTSFNGIVSLTNTTNSTGTNSTSGALQVAGGVGIGGKLYVGSDVSFNGDVRCLKKLYIGVNDPGGGGADTAYFEYVAPTAGIEKTVLRLNVSNDGIGSNSDDNINLNPSGGVGIGTDTPAYKLDVQGTIRATGQITGGSFNTPSDYRIKQNVQVLNKMIDQLKPIEYDVSGGKHDMGFLAHEVQEIFPFLVNGDKDGDQLQSINYTGFISLLVKEVQDLKKENKLLHEKNEQFENRLKVLENKFYV